MRDATSKYILQQLDYVVIFPSTSEWASAVELVRNMDCSVQFCVDCRRKKEATVPDTYKMPCMDDCIDILGYDMVLTTLDENCGYWKIPVVGEDQGKKSLNTHMGTYRYKRITFLLRNEHSMFQLALDIILSSVYWKLCL